MQKNDIIIANPMYDVVFKTLIENKDIARYIVETIIDEEIVEIEFAQQEYVYYIQTEAENVTKTVKVIRLDFVATILTKDGKEKKVMIEIQKSLNPIDIFRFKSYIGKQYSLQDNAIYILGCEIDDGTHVMIP